MSKVGERFALTALFGAAAVGWITVGFRKTPYDELFETVAAAWGINPNLLRAIARRESNFNPKAINTQRTPADPSDDDIGLMQVNVKTAAHYGVTREALLDSATNAHTAARLLVDLRSELGSRLSLVTLIASYNAGSPAILKRGIFNTDYTYTVWALFQLYQLGRAFEPSTGVAPV